MLRHLHFFESKLLYRLDVVQHGVGRFDEADH